MLGWAGQGRAAGPSRPERDPSCDGVRVRVWVRATPVARRGLRAQAERQSHPPALYFCFRQKVTESPNLGSASNFLGEAKPKLLSGPRFPLTSGGCNLPCVLHGVVGRLRGGPDKPGDVGVSVGDHSSLQEKQQLHGADPRLRKCQPVGHPTLSG